MLGRINISPPHVPNFQLSTIKDFKMHLFGMVATTKFLRVAGSNCIDATYHQFTSGYTVTMVSTRNACHYLRWCICAKLEILLPSDDGSNGIDQAFLPWATTVVAFIGDFEYPPSDVREQINK